MPPPLPIQPSLPLLAGSISAGCTGRHWRVLASVFVLAQYTSLCWSSCVLPSHRGSGTVALARIPSQVTHMVAERAGESSHGYVHFLTLLLFPLTLHFPLPLLFPLSPLRPLSPLPPLLFLLSSSSSPLPPPSPLPLSPSPSLASSGQDMLCPFCLCDLSRLLDCRPAEQFGDSLFGRRVLCLLPLCQK